MRGLALGLGLWACEAPPAAFVPVPPSASSSITLDARGRLWVASPDDDQIVRIGQDDLEPVWRLSVPGEPVALASAGDHLLVALAQGHEALRIDLETRRPERLALPCGGIGAVAARGDRGFFACPWDDRVVEVDLAAWQIAQVHAVPGRPTALAASATGLAIGTSAPGALVVDGERWSLEERPGHAATRVLGLAAHGDDFLVAFQVVAHDADRDRRPEDGGYGRVVDGQPRIHPRLVGCGPALDYAVFDGGERVFSGPRAVAVAGGLAWVVHEATRNVVVLTCDENPRVIKTFRVGPGPRGIALTPDGRTAFVDVAHDRAVARLSLDRGEVFSRKRTVGPGPLGIDGARGRVLFHDAHNPHLTPSGVVSCATCHPDGGEDGLVWFIHTAAVAPKLRRTPPAWAGRPALAPYHWDGTLPDAADLSLATLRALMEGDGLLVDTSAMAAYLAALRPPPGRPALDAEDAALIAQGSEIFAESCASCHPAPHYADGRTHPLGASAEPLAHLDAVDTPSLLGVRARPPFLHDGRAPDLAALLAQHFAADQPAPARAALIRFLESL